MRDEVDRMSQVRASAEGKRAQQLEPAGDVDQARPARRRSCQMSTSSAAAAVILPDERLCRPRLHCQIINACSVQPAQCEHIVRALSG